MTWIKWLAHVVTTVAFSLLLAVVVAGLSAPWVPLHWLPALQLIPPSFLLLGVCALLFFLLFLRQKRMKWAAMAGLALACVLWVVSKDFKFTPSPELHCDLRVISYNVGSFGFETDRVKQIARLLRQQNADIIALQEFRNHDMEDRQQAVEYLSRMLEMPDYRFEHLPEHTHGAVIFSRFPIIAVDTMFMPREEINTGVIATVESPLGRIGIGNLHLSSYRVSEFLQNEGTGRREKVRRLFRQSMKVLPRQQERVNQVMASTRSYAYPLILAGDFNAVPHSRIMQPFFDRYTDSFHAAGQWAGWSYPIVGPLGFRIDYQFSTSALIPTQHRVLQVKTSDHQPLEVCYTLQP